MAKKYAKGGPTDEGSANEVLFPKGLQKTAQEMLEQAKKEKREAKQIKAPAKVPEMKKGGSVKEYMDGGMAGNGLRAAKMLEDRARVNRALRGGAGAVMKKGGSVGSASKRADGCATKGKTKGKFV